MSMRTRVVSFPFCLQRLTSWPNLTRQCTGFFACCFQFEEKHQKQLNVSESQLSWLPGCQTEDWAWSWSRTFPHSTAICCSYSKQPLEADWFYWKPGGRFNLWNISIGPQCPQRKMKQSPKNQWKAALCLWICLCLQMTYLDFFMQKLPSRS